MPLLRTVVRNNRSTGRKDLKSEHLETLMKDSSVLNTVSYHSLITLRHFFYNSLKYSQMCSTYLMYHKNPVKKFIKSNCMWLL